jgi:subtilisin family serine protease
MKQPTPYQFFATLLLLALSVQMSSFSIKGQFLKTDKTEVVSETKNNDENIPQHKIAPDLEESVDNLMSGFNPDQIQRVIIQLKSSTPLNNMFGNDLPDETKKDLFIQEIQSNKQKAGVLLTDLAQMNGRMKKTFNNLGLVSAELPLSKVRELAENENVEYISPDREVTSFGHIGNTTGWTNTGIADNGDTDPNTWLAGGVGHVAIIDSGIDTNHELIRWMGAGSQSKVAYQKDFTGQGLTGDPFGHGSHVASMLSGDWVLHDSAYEAPANGASLINLRVLNSTGQGTVSNLVAALDWTVANKTDWNIRVVNISLGTVAKDSYKNDPLCLAARRAVNAGMVVVVSAGNNGKDANGNKVYGSISSPGIEPSVITVGAANTYGTDDRSDDTVATFSSRGPTRGYVTLTNGSRKYDNLIKPDLIAPGNKLIGARAFYNNQVNYLSNTYSSSLNTGNDTVNSKKVMYLSGTSMAAPIVAGAAALLIQVNPKLTPNLIKAILMYSAQPLRNFNTFEQGAGLLNTDGAVRLARLVKTTLPTTNGNALLKSALPTSQTSSIAGQTVYWGKGIITNHVFLYGNDLMNKWQGMYASGIIMGDSTPYSGGTITRSTTLTSGTLSMSQGAVTQSGIIMGDGTLFVSGITMGDGVTIGQGVVMGDGIVMGDTTLTVLPTSSQSLIGDNTACMQPAL